MDTIYKGLSYQIEIQTEDGTSLEGVTGYLYNKATESIFEASISSTERDDSKILLWDSSITLQMPVNNYSLDVILNGKMLYHSDTYAICSSSSQSINN